MDGGKQNEVERPKRDESERDEIITGQSSNMRTNRTGTEWKNPCTHDNLQLNNSQKDIEVTVILIVIYIYILYLVVLVLHTVRSCRQNL